MFYVLYLSPHLHMELVMDEVLLQQAQQYAPYPP